MSDFAKRMEESTQNVPNDDLISRKAAIDLVKDVCNAILSGCESWYDPEIEDEVYKDIHEVATILKCNKEVRIALRNLPSVLPEHSGGLYVDGYNDGYRDGWKEGREALRKEIWVDDRDRLD